MMAARTICLIALLGIACRDQRVTPVQLVAGGDADRGVGVIQRYGCGTCHVIPGVRAARGKTGPPLTDFSERAYIAGAVTNRPEELVRWILDPGAVQPGTAMPDLGLSEPEARDAAAFLYTVGGTRLGPSYLLPRRWLERP